LLPTTEQSFVHLSLSVFFIVAQDCSKPVGGDNMGLKGDDILLQTFPEGKKVTFVCNNGYVTAGGSPSITCTAGNWTTLMLKCERYNCGSAGEVANGNIDYPEGTEFGDKLVVTCNPCYNMVPNNVQLFCGAQGWLGRLPTCEVVTCDPPPTVANGVVTPVKDSYDCSEVVQYKCQNDYTLSGSSSISCSEHGTFGPAPTCVRKLVQCEDPKIDNADQIEGSRPPHGYMSTVTYECKSGYVMKGGRTLTCGIDSQWSPALPTCQSKAAPPAAMETYYVSRTRRVYAQVGVASLCSEAFFGPRDPTDQSDWLFCRRSARLVGVSGPLIMNQ
uniref:Sushi domain-containing protein n=1 Tax=Sander lucioperca TaxID=283035 RepID=A0A8C9XX27_SANLU